MVKSGDFHLDHWVSNDIRLLVKLPPFDSKSNKFINIGAYDAEIILGITERPATNILGFRMKLIHITYTSVELLSKVRVFFTLRELLQNLL